MRDLLDTFNQQESREYAPEIDGINGIETDLDTPIYDLYDHLEMEDDRVAI